MALLFIDGFEEYASSADCLLYNSNLTSRWTSQSDFSSNCSTTAKTAQTTISGKSYQVSNGVMHLTIPATTATLIVGMYARPGSWNNQVFGLCQTGGFSYVSNGATGVRVALNSSGNFVVINNQSGATIGTTAATYPTNTWYHLQLKYVFGTGTSGSVELKVDDVSVISVSGINSTGNATNIANVYLQSGSGVCYWDDFWVCDDSGTTNNDFLGPMGVYTLIPNGAGSSTQMTASAGSNYTCVDEIGANTTDYVTATASGQEDLYNMTDLPVTPTTVAGVMVKARSLKNNPNPALIQMSCKSGGSNGYSPSMATYVATYKDNYHIFESNPAGGAWAAATVNSIEAGIKGV